jgi:hypothetical protein
MLDPVVCAGMQLGAPRVAVVALVDLHQLLVERGLRACSSDDPIIVQEKPSDQAEPIGADCAAIAVDDSAAVEHCVRLHPTSGDEPGRTRESAHALGSPPDASRRRRDSVVR